MSKKKIDTDMPMGELIAIEDFLPPPNELALPEKTEKITISLSRSSVEFFKREASKHHTKYQRMIREILDKYAAHYNLAT